MIKHLTAYIEKTFKTTVVFAGAFALIGSSLMFCCLTMTAHASTQSSKVPSCHQVKKDIPQADHSKKCDCCKIKPSDSEALVKALDLIPSFVKSFHAVITRALAYAPQARLSHLAYTGPPRANMSLPIYLQLSTLRL